MPIDGANVAVAPVAGSTRFQRFFLALLVVAAFLLLMAPGFYFISLFYQGVKLDSELLSWQNDVNSIVLPRLSGWPASLGMLLVAAFPIAFSKACFRSDGSGGLSITGAVCLVLAAAGFLGNAAGFMLADADNLDLPSKVGGSSVKILGPLSEKAAYVCVMNGLALLGMRPKQ